MKCSELGELGLIERIAQNSIVNPATVVMGIGDDAAVLLPGERRLQLVTADMLVEHVHFTLAMTSPRQLGYKAAAVNLSDIAAMGGTPLHLVVCIALPDYITVEWVEEFYAGMKELCGQHQVNLVGGDTVGSRGHLTIGVTALGEVRPTLLTKRSGAKDGDLIVVTGTLGNAAAGLHILQQGGWEQEMDTYPLVWAQLIPQPRVQEGQRLAAAGVHCMDDISDGLSAEVHAICKASGVGALIDLAALPLSKRLLTCRQWYADEPQQLALHGGEDYELLVTVARDHYRQLQELEWAIPLTVVGEIVPQQEGIKVRDLAGRVEPLPDGGFVHFDHGNGG